MKSWSLKTKVSVYCLLLTAAALLGTALIIFPVVYQLQLKELDKNLHEDAQQIFEDNKARFTNTTPPALRRKTNGGVAIRSSLARRYIVVEVSNQEIYRTKFRNLRNFKDVDLHILGEGSHTVAIQMPEDPRPSDSPAAPATPPAPDAPASAAPATSPASDSPASVSAPPPKMIEKDCRFVQEHFGPVTIWVGTRLGVLEDTRATIQMAYFFAIPTAMVLVFFGARLLAGRALSPVSAMTAVAECIGAHNPDERLPVPTSNDEISRLTVVLNQSFDRLQRAYSSAARFSADASHQLKTPIAVLRAGLDEMRTCDYLQPMERETVDTLVQQTRRLTALVEDLLLLAQADAGRLKIEPQPVDLTPLLSNVVDDTEVLGDEKNLIVTLHAPAQLYAKGDPRRVNIILQNLSENAVKYNRQHGKLRISARREGQWVTVTVANTGSAIPDQYRDRLFERFNRAGMGENIKGHGLGLNIARELARAHGGDLILTRSDPEWTEFALRLPAAEAPVLDSVSPLKVVAA